MAVFLERRECLGENHVGPCFDVGGRALERRLLSFDRMGIGPRHDGELRIVPAIDGGPNPVDHFPGLDECFAGPVSTALDRYLVLDMAACRAGTTQVAHGPADHEGATKSRIGIDQERQRRRTGDAAHILTNIVERRHGQVRQAKRSIGNTGARQVDSAETRSLREQCRVCIHGANDLQWSLGDQRRSESRAWRHG